MKKNKKMKKFCSKIAIPFTILLMAIASFGLVLCFVASIHSDNEMGYVALFIISISLLLLIPYIEVIKHSDGKIDDFFRNKKTEPNIFQYPCESYSKAKKKVLEELEEKGYGKHYEKSEDDYEIFVYNRDTWLKSFGNAYRVVVVYAKEYTEEIEKKIDTQFDIANSKYPKKPRYSTYITYYVYFVEENSKELKDFMNKSIAFFPRSGQEYMEVIVVLNEKKLYLKNWFDFGSRPREFNKLKRKLKKEFSQVRNKK